MAYREYKNVERNVPDGAENLTIEPASAKEKKLRDRWQQQSATQGKARQRRSLRIGLACFSLYPVFAKGFEVLKHTHTHSTNPGPDPDPQISGSGFTSLHCRNHGPFEFWPTINPPFEVPNTKQHTAHIQVLIHKLVDLDSGAIICITSRAPLSTPYWPTIFVSRFWDPKTQTYVQILRSQNIDVRCTYPGPDPHICGSGFRSHHRHHIQGAAWVHTYRPNHVSRFWGPKTQTRTAQIQVLIHLLADLDSGPIITITSRAPFEYQLTIHVSRFWGPKPNPCLYWGLTTIITSRAHIEYLSTISRFWGPKPIHVCIQVPFLSHPGPFEYWLLTNHLSSFWGPKPIHVLISTSRAQERGLAFYPSIQVLI